MKIKPQEAERACLTRLSKELLDEWQRSAQQADFSYLNGVTACIEIVEARLAALDA